ncbi:MAG: hypothetical protein V7K71_25145 [Nostoc sp.]|uniref:hypothetical protein n=1 Tax=Nostoc sp. TaxID=1180 RepID=UPI002FF768AC
MLDYFYTTRCVANFSFFSINKLRGDRNALYAIALTRCNPSQQESIFSLTAENLSNVGYCSGVLGEI